MTQATQRNIAKIDQRHIDGAVFLTSSGLWNVHSLNQVSKQLEQLVKTIKNTAIEWNISQVEQVDSAGMMLFIHYYDLLKSNNCSIQMTGTKLEHKKLYRLLRKHVAHCSISKDQPSSSALQVIESVGKTVVSSTIDVRDFLTFVGENFIHLIYSLRHPGSIRLSAITKNIEEAGLRALPIIALTSFLIGVVIAYQGAVQLEKFGANIFIVDMIGVSITRELAPLITAIVVAGRTGSSYTAQIGVMKLTEEIAAMRTMGFEPHRFLVLPRIIALMIALPLLIFFADIIGIAAGMFISHIHLDLSYTEFITRLQSVLPVKHVWIGLCKGPVFAWLIATVGCWRGFQVSISTESIGRYTTTSVVNSIFLVIAVDALFSVVLTELGI